MRTSRRNFLKSAVATGLGLAILPNWVIGKSVGPNSRINVAFVGLGNRGEAATNALKKIKMCVLPLIAMSMRQCCRGLQNSMKNLRITEIFA